MSELSIEGNNMTNYDIESTHIANNLPKRLQGRYNDLYNDLVAGLNQGLDDPAFREIELNDLTKGPQVEVLPGNSHRQGSRLLLRSNATVIQPAMLSIQIEIDKDDVCRLLDAMRSQSESGGFFGLRYYNAILVLPNVVKPSDPHAISSGGLSSPLPPRFREFAEFNLDYKGKAALRQAMLQLEADTEMSPSEYIRWLHKQNS